MTLKAKMRSEGLFAASRARLSLTRAISMSRGASDDFLGLRTLYGQNIQTCCLTQTLSST